MWGASLVSALGQSFVIGTSGIPRPYIAFNALLLLSLVPHFVLNFSVHRGSEPNLCQ